jgi:prolyl-tRNA synthetase
MQLSNFFLPILDSRLDSRLDSNPEDSSTISEYLMLRSGMIKRSSTYKHIWLPIGYMVLHNIKKIIRKNMNDIGCMEIIIPHLQTNSHASTDADYEQINEQIVAGIVQNSINLSLQLPKIFYQMQWRVSDNQNKNNLLHSGDRITNDAYSFDADQASAVRTYQEIFAVYIKIFKDLGIAAIPVQNDCGHEFHICTNIGDSMIRYDKRFDVIAQDTEVQIDEMLHLHSDLSTQNDLLMRPAHREHSQEHSQSQLVVCKSISVGSIMRSVPSEILNSVANPTCIGICIGKYTIDILKLVMSIIDSSHDKNGIIWNEAIAPFKVSIINLSVNNAECRMLSERIYKSLSVTGIDVLYDDTKTNIETKILTHDLIGSPWQIFINNDAITSHQVELKHRLTGEKELLDVNVAVKKLLATVGV